MTIQVKAPPRMRAARNLHGSTNPFFKTTWMELDIDRVEISVDNSVKDHPQPDEETTIMQVAAGKQIINLAGHLTEDSDFIGSDVAEKAKNLVYAGRYWYYGLRAKSTSFPQLHWNNKIYDCLIQKVVIMDAAASGNNLMYYNIGLVIKGT